MEKNGQAGVLEGKGGKTGAAKKYDRTNFFLLAVGVGLLIVAPLYARLIPEAAAAQGRLLESALAAVIALGVTIALWSLFPEPTALKGKMGVLKLAGPAALGVALWYNLQDRTVVEEGRVHLVLPSEGERRVNGKRVRALHIATLPDKQLCETVKSVRRSVPGTDQEKSGRAVETVTAAALDSGVISDAAEMKTILLACLDASGEHEEESNARWVKLLDKSGQNFPKIADRRPFGVLEVEGRLKTVTVNTKVPELGGDSTVRAIAAYSKHDKASVYAPMVVIERQKQ